MFNPASPTVMHIDLNSCFATIEQQANPALRGRPVAVAVYTTPGGCILAASYEAKGLGVKTGMRVRDGRALAPDLIILPPDPEKYRFVNHALKKLLLEYTPILSVESIDEMVLNFAGTPKLQENSMAEIGREVKRRIKGEIGEWLTVSVGIATNRYLAKVASCLHKPDGLDAITKENIESVLSSMVLEDLCGIKDGYGKRLRYAGIATPIDMYRAGSDFLMRAFHSIIGYHWSLRLHGWKDPGQAEEEQKTVGHSYALKIAYETTDPQLHQILTQLVLKMGKRLRDAGCTALGMHVSCLFTDHTYWHHGHKYQTAIFADRDCYERALSILLAAPVKPVRILAVNVFALTTNLYQQESLLDEEVRKKQLTQALDAIHDRWGDFVITPARMLAPIKSGLAMEPASTRRESGRVQRGEHKVLDRIAFGKV